MGTAAGCHWRVECRCGWIPRSAYAVAVLSTVIAGSPAAAAEALPAASSDEHLWFVVETERPEPRIELRHHTPQMDGPFYSQGLPLSRMPQAMAAWDNQLWLIYGPKRSKTSLRREVFTVQVERNPALGIYFHHPHDRLRAMTSLDSPGVLSDFVGTAQGPVALLRPSQRASAGVRSRDAAGAIEPLLEGPRLLKLHGPDWVELELPPDFAAPSTSRLGVAGPGGRVLVLLDPAPARAGHATVWWRDGEGPWSRSDIPVGLPGLRKTARVGGSLALVLDGARPGSVDIGYLRPTQLLPLAELTTPDGRWSVVGVRDGLRLLEEDASGRVTIRAIDPLSGALGRRQDLTRHKPPTGRLLHRPLLFAVAITALMVVLLFKPNPKTEAVALPPDVAVCSPMTRLVAVAIDLVVGAVVTLIVLRCPLTDLLQMPMWTADLTESMAFLLMVGVTALHSTIAEVVSGRTLGKAFVGARVVTITGARPPAITILFRNTFKLLVLLIPVLALFALLNPNVQGLGDSVARTVVVRATDTDSKDR